MALPVLPEVPLDDVVTQEMRGDVDNSYWKMASAEGRIYMLPYLARQNVLGYHRSLLRQAGLGRYVSDGEDICLILFSAYVRALAHGDFSA